MIEPVTSDAYPFLRVHVRVDSLDAPTFEFDVEALVDTGFDGGLAISRDLIPEGVVPVGRSVWNLADGTEITALSYFCYVSIGHLQAVPTVVITLDGDALLGRHVTDTFRVTFDRGRRVIVEP
jgi:predicted aspartyl protease